MLSGKSTLWFRNNFASIITELRYFKYPDYTWGIGGNTDEGNRSIMEFEYLRYYQALLKKVAGNTSLGVGYRFDKHYNIEEQLEDSTKPPILQGIPMAPPPGHSHRDLPYSCCTIREKFD